MFMTAERGGCAWCLLQWCLGLHSGVALGVRTRCCSTSRTISCSRSYQQIT